jgi:hypothetical protein
MLFLMGALLLFWLTKLLVGLFLLGLVGSAIVVVITFFEDARLLLESDVPAAKPQPEQEAHRAVQAREAF